MYVSAPYPVYIPQQPQHMKRVNKGVQSHEKVATQKHTNDGSLSQENGLSGQQKFCAIPSGCGVELSSFLPS
jgi:hypothetical protein